MLYLRESAKGIDRNIQLFQAALYTYLLDKWNLSTDVLQGYGRVYRQRKGDEYQATVYVGNSAKDYRHVTGEDTQAATYFFSVGETVTIGVNHSVEVALILFCDLDKIGKDIASTGETFAHIPDEEVRLDVINFMKLKGQIAGFKMLTVETGLDKVLTEYSATKKSFYKYDMYPNHCFRINYKLTYKP